MNILKNVYAILSYKTDFLSHKVNLNLINDINKASDNLAKVVSSYQDAYEQSYKFIKAFGSAWKNKVIIDEKVSKSLEQRPEVIKKLQDTYDKAEKIIFTYEDYYKQIIKERDALSKKMLEVNKKIKELGLDLKDASTSKIDIRDVTLALDIAKGIIDGDRPGVSGKVMIIDKYNGKIK